MIEPQRLLADLRPLLRTLEADLLERSESPDVPEVGRRLRAEHLEARRVERTAQSYEEWRADYATQVAAAWVLSCVFVRFLEDNRLIDPPRLSGPGARLQRSLDEHEVYFRAHPTETDREYLLAVFDELQRLPGASELFGPHNPLRDLPNWLSGDAAGELLRFFQKINPTTGALLHDFQDQGNETPAATSQRPTPNAQGPTPKHPHTRFLGDLYQDLSEAARKKYALLQTPEFVEEFILDRTLDPAVEEFGLGGFRMIDPACGSGHFLLGSFARLLDRWQRKEPGANVRVLAQRALDSIHGVDLNPYAVAIARFRLLLAAMQACGIPRLADAPDFRLNLACGDSLLHEGQLTLALDLDSSTPAHLTPNAQRPTPDAQHAYPAEDLAALQRILLPGRYHAVVANPPYITPKDPAMNQRYRQRFRTCHRQYSLSVPFMERIFGLAVPGGFTGQITANSFMKREFGKKLIEEFLPLVDLTHVIDTSGAYIPGHGTPTVILVGRNRRPVSSTIRTVLGIRGEPSTPEDPARGRVWTAILSQIDQPGSQSEWVSAADTRREPFHKHPWSIGGGGAAELKERIDGTGQERLELLVTSIGFASFTGTDEAFLMEAGVLQRLGMPREMVRPCVVGDSVRAWITDSDIEALVPYDTRFEPVTYSPEASWGRYLWRFRTSLRNVLSFGGKTRLACGDAWWTWYRWIKDKYSVPKSIVYSEVATHNHFVMDEGGKVFKQTAPVIKLPATATRTEQLSLLGLLNSSTACFWLKQVCHNKGSTVDQHGARQRTAPFEDFYAFNATKLEQFPLPGEPPEDLPRHLHALGQRLQELSPGVWLPTADGTVIRDALRENQAKWELTRERMIALQEELDWQCYRLYGLLDEELTYGEEPPPIQLGQRAFEIVMARKMAAGELQTTWFERHRSTPTTGIPAEWPEAYRRLIERRIETIETDANIRLIEQPEYKRRWNTEPWEEQLKRSLRGWLLDRLEGYFDFDGRMAAGPRQAVNDLPTPANAPEGASAGSEAATAEREASRPTAEGPFTGLSMSRQVVYGLPGEGPGAQPAPANAPEEAPGAGGPFTGLRPSRQVLPGLPADRAGAQVPTARFDFELVSTQRLADVAGADPEFMQVAELYRNDPAFDVRRLVDELVLEESVPLLPVLRYKDTGLRKRAAWERTWELQRQEDAIDARTRLPEGDPERLTEQQARARTQQEVGEIPVPPKYASADFLESACWRLRGKLDVPKERWVRFPFCEGPDGAPRVAWAGYDHLQLAQAVSAYFVEVQERLGGREDPRLVPLLASLIELLPWLKQWHNEVHPEYGVGMGDYFEGFIQEEARQMGRRPEEVRTWQPPQRSRRRGSVQS